MNKVNDIDTRVATARDNNKNSVGYDQTDSYVWEAHVTTSVTNYFSLVTRRAANVTDRLTRQLVGSELNSQKTEGNNTNKSHGNFIVPTTV